MIESLHEGKMSDAMREWIQFYEVDLKELMEHACPKGK